MLYQKIFASIHILLFFHFPSEIGNNEPYISGNLLSTAPDPCSSDNLAYTGGEEIVYKLFYNLNFVWVAAGEVEFTVKETFYDYEISARGRTYKSYEWFYKVDDKYKTVIDKTTMLPKLFERDVNEGNYKFYNRIEFDQKSGKAVSFDGKNRNNLRNSEAIFNGCMHDMMSIIFHFRNIQYGDLKNGDAFPISIFLDEKAWDLNVHFKGREKNFKVKGLGNFDVLKFSPEVIEGHQFKEDTKINVWVTDDMNKVPVMVESPISVGSVKAVLKSYNGLKHPMNAKVK